MTEHKQPESNGLAIASLVLGILSLTGASVFTGIPAIITGAISLKTPANRGMSLAGLIMGAVSVVFAVLIFLFIMLLLIIAAVSSSADSPSNSSRYDQFHTSVQHRI